MTEPNSVAIWIVDDYGRTHYDLSVVGTYASGDVF